MTRGPLQWFARRVLVWALGDECPYLDPLSTEPDAFDRMERALRSRLHEPPCPDFDRLAREVLEAPDRTARQMAVGKLLALQMNELKIARATAYVLGHTFREIREERGEEARWRS